MELIISVLHYGSTLLLLVLAWQLIEHGVSVCYKKNQNKKGK